MAHFPIALQLYTLRTLTQRHLAGTLLTVGRLGYRHVELADLGGHKPADMRRMLADAGLSAIAAHVGLEELETRTGQVAADYAARGVDTIVMPWVAPELRAGAGAWRRLGDRLTRVARALKPHQI